MSILGLKTESDKMLHLDALRFFASMAIVIFHWGNDFIGIPARVFTSHLEFLSLAVDLFFIISGVVMFQVYSHRLSTGKEFATFVQRRIARLYPLHLATFLFMAALGIGVHSFHLTASHVADYDPRGIIPNLLLVQSLGVLKHGTFNYPAWSISAEMVCYISFPLILILYRRKWWSPIVLATIFMALLVVLTDGWQWTTWTEHFGVVRAIPAFMFGVVLGGSKRYLKSLPYPQVMLVIAGSAFFLLGYFCSARSILLLLVYLIAISAFAADTQAASNSLIKAAAPLGVLTFSIYMIHALFMPVFFGFLFRRMHLAPLANNLSICLCVFPLLAVSYLSYRHFETPARRWISSLGTRQMKASTQPSTTVV